MLFVTYRVQKGTNSLNIVCSTCRGPCQWLQYSIHKTYPIDNCKVIVCFLYILHIFKFDTLRPLLVLPGTVFLWMFWPSFNGGAASGDEQHRAIINTYLSLTACTVITFAVSQLVNKRGRFNMVYHSWSN